MDITYVRVHICIHTTSTCMYVYMYVGRAWDEMRSSKREHIHVVLGGGGGVTPPGAFVGGSRAVLCVGPNPCPRQLLVVVLCRMPCHATRRRQLHRIKVLPQGERLGCPCRWPPTSIPNPCCFHIDIDICVCMMLRSVTCSGIQCSHSISNYISIYRMCNMNRI